MLHGNKTYLLQDPEDKSLRVSISAGLDYPGISNEGGLMIRTLKYVFNDAEALDAFKPCCKKNYSSF